MFGGLGCAAERQATAGPSTASFAKCSNDFSQDDKVWGGGKK